MSDISHNLLTKYYGFNNEPSRLFRKISSEDKFEFEDDFDEFEKSEDENENNNSVESKSENQNVNNSQDQINNESQIKDEDDINNSQGQVNDSQGQDNNLQGQVNNVQGQLNNESLHCSVSMEESNSVSKSDDNMSKSLSDVNFSDKMTDHMTDQDADKNEVKVEAQSFPGENGKEMTNSEMIKMESIIDRLREPNQTSNFFDISKCNVNEIPLELIERLSGIKMLYLEGNNIEKLPDELFTCLPNLEWFDARRNKLKSFPKTVKYHKSLETILLKQNEIRELPLELGLVFNLKQLQLTQNPLTFPSINIVQRGFKAVINFLRDEWNIEHPEETVDALPIQNELKPTPSTILCYKEKPLKRIKMLSKTNQTSFISKRRNYKMTDRYQNKLPNDNSTLLCKECISNISLNKNDKIQKMKQVRKKMNKINAQTQTDVLQEKEEKDEISMKKSGRNEKKLKTFRRRDFNALTQDGRILELHPLKLTNPERTVDFLDNFIDVDFRHVAV